MKLERIMIRNALIEKETAKREFSKKMVELTFSNDVEEIHGAADEALLSYLTAIGHEDIVYSYNLLRKSSGGFWYA
jgi:hypothetical protein